MRFFGFHSSYAAELAERKAEEERFWKDIPDCRKCGYHKKKHCIKFNMMVLDDSVCNEYRPWFLMDAVMKEKTMENGKDNGSKRLDAATEEKR